MVTRKNSTLTKDIEDAILDLTIVSPSPEIFDHSERALFSKGVVSQRIGNYRAVIEPKILKAEQNIFNGQRPPVLKKQDYELAGAAKDTNLNKALPDLQLKMQYREKNESTGQNQSIPIYLYVGPNGQSIESWAEAQGAKADDYLLKFWGTFLPEYLWPLGLDYDFKKASVVDRASGEILTQEALKELMNSEGQLKVKDSFINEAKKSIENNPPLLAQDASFNLRLTVIDFPEERVRAKPIG